MCSYTRLAAAIPTPSPGRPSGSQGACPCPVNLSTVLNCAGLSWCLWEGPPRLAEGGVRVHGVLHAVLCRGVSRGGSTLCVKTAPLQTPTAEASAGHCQQTLSASGHRWRMVSASGPRLWMVSMAGHCQRTVSVSSVIAQEPKTGQSSRKMQSHPHP